MPDQPLQTPIIRKPTPVVLDELLIETADSNRPNLYDRMLEVGHFYPDQQKYAGYRLLKMEPNSYGRMQYFWGNGFTAQDGYNAVLEYEAQVNAFPKFQRTYRVLRSDYLVNGPSTKLQPFTGVAAIFVTAGGSGYTEDFAVAFSGGGGTGSAGLAIVDKGSGAVIRVELNAVGSAYTSAPAISFAAGSGTSAAATAVIQPTAAVLTEEVHSKLPEDDPYQSLYDMVRRNWETLPGPYTVEVSEFQSTGIPVITARQDVSAFDFSFNEGEWVPQAINVTGISVATSGLCTVTLASAHNLPPRAWIAFVGTTSSPSIIGNQRIVSVPAANQVVIAVNTVSGSSGGTMQGVNRVVTELKPRDGSALVNVKIDSVAAVPDVTIFNESVAGFRPYPFPDYLRGVTSFADDGNSTTLGNTYALSLSSSGTYLLDIQDGARTGVPCIRHRIFSNGPPTAASLAAYKPTTIILSRGSVAIKSKTNHLQQTTGAQTTAFSYSTKTGTIPPVLAAGGFAFTPTSGVTGQIELAPSVPARFIQGDTIMECEQAQKLGAGLWQIFAYEMTATYTSGLPPGDFLYLVMNASYASSTLITPNTAVGMASATGWAITPALPSGLSFNTSTGAISGTPSGANPVTAYTVTATLSGKTVTTYLLITVT